MASSSEDREADEAACRAAIEAGDSGAWLTLGRLLAAQPGRASEAEDCYQAAIEAGDARGVKELGELVASRATREREVRDSRAGVGTRRTKVRMTPSPQSEQSGPKISYRAEVTSSDAGERVGVLRTRIEAAKPMEGAEMGAVRDSDAERAYREASLLANQPGREAEAEAAYRDAIAFGEAEVSRYLRKVEAERPGGGADARAEEAYPARMKELTRQLRVILGLLLKKQPGREREAEECFRANIDSGATGRVLLASAANLGGLLARRGDAAGAQAAYELSVRAITERFGCDLSDSTIAKVARFNAAVARRRWARLLMRPLAQPARLADRIHEKVHQTGHRPS